MTHEEWDRVARRPAEFDALSWAAMLEDARAMAAGAPPPAVRLNAVSSARDRYGMRGVLSPAHVSLAAPTRTNSADRRRKESAA